MKNVIQVITAILAAFTITIVLNYAVTWYITSFFDKNLCFELISNIWFYVGWFFWAISVFSWIKVLNR